MGAINLQVLCMKKREENRNLTKSYNLVGVPAVAACCGCLLWLPAVAAYFFAINFTCANLFLLSRFVGN